MRLYIIKHKGNFYWGNLLRNLTMQIDDKEIPCNIAFERKKDAKIYLELLIKKESRKYYEIMPLVPVARGSK